MSECHEGVSRNGEFQPCDKPAVAERWDERAEFPGWYPVCPYHTRGKCRPLMIVRAALESELRESQVWAEWFAAERDALRATLDEIAAPLKSVADTLAFSARDWSIGRDTAWLYGIIHGWDAENGSNESAMPEMARVHGWDEREVTRLRKLHTAVAAILNRGQE